MKLINPSTLSVGDRVTLYRYHDDKMASNDMARNSRTGTVIGRMKHGDNIIIRLDAGYTECWWSKDLFISMNDPELHYIMQNHQTLSLDAIASFSTQEDNTCTG